MQTIEEHRGGGHLAFWLADHRVLFVGDAVVISPKFMAGWPGFVLNWQRHRASLRQLAAYDAEVMPTGHGEPIRENAATRLRGLL